MLATTYRMRFTAPGVHTIYEAVVTGDGKRRIGRDDLGTITCTANGWDVRIFGHDPHLAADPHAALTWAAARLD